MGRRFCLSGDSWDARPSSRSSSSVSGSPVSRALLTSPRFARAPPARCAGTHEKVAESAVKLLDVRQHAHAVASCGPRARASCSPGQWRTLYKRHECRGRPCSWSQSISATSVLTKERERKTLMRKVTAEIRTRGTALPELSRERDRERESAFAGGYRARQRLVSRSRKRALSALLGWDAQTTCPTPWLSHRGRRQGYRARPTHRARRRRLVCESRWGVRLSESATAPLQAAQLSHR
jgi:hypothetical protein